MEYALFDGLKARAMHELPEPVGGRVVDLSLDGGDANVVDEPAPEAVAVSVDDHQSASRTHDPPHFCDRAILTGVMVKTVGAGHDIERPRSKRKPLTVSAHGEHVRRIEPPAGLTLFEHSRNEVDATDLDVR